MDKQLRLYRSKLSKGLKNNFGLVILSFFLCMVTLANLPQPNHWLAGWDNFSVSLDLPLNFARTVFATWREYRGFGVPSDSEVVDIFRQLPLLILGLLVPSWTLEWIYYFGMYWLGAIGVFYLTKSVVSNLIKHTFANFALQMAGLIGAIAYATNLYTIDVFYFPITLYIVRHGFLPWIIWCTHQLLIQAQPSRRLWLWFTICILFASPGALTATVFFVTAMIIGCLLIFQGTVKRKMQVGLLLISLQLFWLLPFGNYFLQKSSQITHANTFVPINEMLLNQPFERFSLDRILTFSADFTSGAPFKDVTRKPIVVHPGLSYAPIGEQPPLGYWSLWAPTIVGVLILVFWQLKKRQANYLWIPLLMGIGVFLLRKEYGFAGQVFDWLIDAVPILKVIFRFGGAKLNPLLILGASVLSGLATTGLLIAANNCKQKILKASLQFGIVTLSLAAVGWMGWYPLTGSLYFRVMSVEFPTAYFQAAKQINDDSSYGRVLHLPYGLHSYWRSHTFGYYGSSFMAFLLKKPLQDKTFNPGNLDHNSYDTSLMQLISNSSKLTPEALNSRSAEFAQFLAHTNTTYILWDPTVGTQIRIQGLITWELVHTVDTNTLIQSLLDSNRATIVGEYPLPGWAQPTLATESSIKIVKLNTTQPVVTSQTTAIVIDPTQTNLLSPSFTSLNTTLLQSNQLPARSYPWWGQNNSLTHDSRFLQLTYNQSDLTDNILSLKAPEIKTHTGNEYVGVDVLAAYVGEQLEIYFRPTPLPFTTQLSSTPTPSFSMPITKQAWENTTLNTSFSNYLNNWHILGNHQTNQYRLAISDQVIPLPANLANQPEYLTSLLLPISDLSQLPISILIADTIADEQLRRFSGNYFSLTPEVNCWNDTFTGFSSTFKTSPDTISATTTHGTLCFGASIDLEAPTQEITTSSTKTSDQRRYFELEFSPKFFSTADTASHTEFPLTTQQELQSLHTSQPVISELFVCLMSTPTGDCLNKQRFLKVSDSDKVRVTSQRLFSEPNLHILMTLPTFGSETQHAEISEMALIGFSPIKSSYASLNLEEYLNPPSATISNNQLAIPYFLSSSSLYTNPKTHGIQVENRGLCQLNQTDRRKNGIQHISTADTGKLQIYLDNCATNVSYYLPYFPTNAYWWSIDYKRIAGGQPQFLANTNLLIADELLGLNQGYPFSATAPATASITIPPQGKFKTNPFEIFSITQYTANQSAFELDTITIFPIPFNWQNSYVESANTALDFAPLAITELKQLLPSLWSVRLTKPINENPSNQDFLLTFNQGYDSQWVLLRGVQKVPAHHLKVNGWANGWIITTDMIPADDTYYLLYLPELLSLAGWIATLIAITSVMFINLKRVVTSPNLTPRKERLTKMVIAALQKSNK